MYQPTQNQETLERIGNETSKIIQKIKGIIGDEDVFQSKHQNPRKELTIYINTLHRINLILRNIANGFDYDTNDLETTLWFQYLASILKHLEKKLSKRRKI